MQHELPPAALTAGVRLISSNPKAWRADGRIVRSAGITPASAQYGHLSYWERSFVPKLPWRRLSDAEFELLLGSEHEAQAGRWLQIITVPRDIYDRFEALRRASQAANSDVLADYIDSADCHWSIDQAMDYARSLTWTTRKTLEGGCVVYKAPQLPTSTSYVHRDNTQLGLHIDNWYKEPIARRRYSPNRVSVNLGLCDRFLLFVNLGLDQIEAVLAKRNVTHGGITADGNTHDFRMAFYQTFPDYPVFKVRLRPGDAYIAPTENVIHDGCTEGQTSYDVQFAVRGHFRPQVGAVSRAAAGVACDA